ncbi:UDP-N-acetylglucosamine 2-epimerase [Alteromonas sp. a30]|uniref:UDP-N-acetylglucosamine 2-epimerase n=1 Tax=Alteromonas sp. a30 TaxID=2730917 RepID=UPI00227F19C5|nr:UDP-N-acetylglucosamine 2-epimerase [Alteromonas sp. a30]MCY7294360.1 UDP-N-acetylglucosamine 2-epimerase (hydrolyzing) [Alteromonas sp. a30]
MKVCVVTGTRAEYGLFYWLLKALNDDPSFELQLVVTGMHLSPEFGSTYQEIEKDGFPIHDTVEILLSGDSPVAITKSTGLALMGFAESFKNLQPDLVMLLGDRFEALGAATAALFANIPIAHLHGGEATFGAVDESIRHAISKMAHIHFPATEEYRARLIQMGEQPESVYNVGALGVESSVKTQALSKQALEESIGFDLGERFFLVTYHPVTLDVQEQREGMQAMLEALDAFPNVKLLITFPNADAHGRELIDTLKRYVSQNSERVYLTESLGRVRYLSALSHCACVVGNSSSGVIEAPSFSVPTVDIGCRQQGRARADSVFNCKPTKDSILKTLNHVMAQKYSAADPIFTNPYDGGETSQQIIEILKAIDLNDVGKKIFNDLN